MELENINNESLVKVCWYLKNDHFWDIVSKICFHKKWTFPIKNFFSKCDQIRSLLKKSLSENFTFCAVLNKLIEPN